MQEQEESQVITETVKEVTPAIQMTLSARLEAIEQKLLKLQSLKDKTIDEFTSLLNERKMIENTFKASFLTILLVVNEVVPILNQLNPSSVDVPIEKESGLSKLLIRLQQLQKEYQKRRSVSEKRLNFKIDAVKERYTADILNNKNESESELAESSVALIHKQMAKIVQNITTKSSDESVSVSGTGPGSSSSVISARKRSLPAINQPICPPVMKMARRQSVAAYPQNLNCDYSNPMPMNHNNREIANSSILNLNLVTSKSVADADLLAIKSRISKALKR